jgi:hypothetical protein
VIERNEIKKAPLLHRAALKMDRIEIQPYGQNLKLHQTRTMFRMRTLIMPPKMNMKNNPKFA